MNRKQIFDWAVAIAMIVVVYWFMSGFLRSLADILQHLVAW